MKKRRSVFLSFNQVDEAIVNYVQDVLRDAFGERVRFSRWEEQVRYGNYFQEYMNRINNHDLTLMFISDSFLRSPNCLYEADRIIGADLENRIRYFRLEKGDSELVGAATSTVPATIGEPEERMIYVDWWRERLRQQIDLVRNHEPYGGQAGELGKLEEQQKRVERLPNFLNHLNDTRGILLKDCIETGFRELIRDLDYKLSELPEYWEEKLKKVQNEARKNASIRVSYAKSFLKELDKFSLPQNIPDEFLDYGYELTDVYESRLQFTESTALAVELLRVYEGRKKDSLKLLRKSVGLAYSLAIGKINDGETRRANLRFADKFLSTLKTDMLGLTAGADYEAIFLRGLYYSNLGAVRMNWAAQRREDGANEEEVNDFYEDALDNHQKALDYRVKAYELASRSVPEREKEAYFRMVTSRNNIASVLYQLGRYDEAIETHKSVMDIREKALDEVAKSYDSRRNIMGCYLAKWEKAQSIDSDEQKDFKKLLQKCETFYQEKNPPSPAYEDYLKKRKQYYDLLEKLKRDKEDKKKKKKKEDKKKKKEE